MARKTLPKSRDLHLEKVQCHAKSKRSGQQCRKWAIPGGTVCPMHGGGQQRNSIAVQEKRVMAKIAKQLGEHLHVSPTEALLEQVWEAAGNVAFLRTKIQGLDDTPSLERDSDGFAYIRTGLYGPDSQGNQAAHVYVKLYNEERDRLARVSKFAIECGIAERQVRIAEKQGEVLVTVVLAVLGSKELGLSAELQSVGRRLVGEKIRQLMPA